MHHQPVSFNWRWPGFIGAAAFLWLVVASLHQAYATPVVEPVETTPRQAQETVVEPHLTYGFNVAVLDEARLNQIGFNGVKLFSPPGARLPYRVLLRVEADASQMANLDGFAANLNWLAQTYGPYIDAYEIGNEPNLDASYGWAASPIAADYAQLLCQAFQAIKAADPTAIVVSAGLAPTGRVTGNWHGHPGHNGFYQDEREYLREMIQAGAGSCLDAVGYHPYGFRADYDAPPDLHGGTPETNCINGFCFRGVEKIYEIMQQYGLGHKEVWATEFGWIVEPPAHCLEDPGWQGRQWQIVSEAKQAENLVGAFAYAHEHYPWMGGMYAFNLDFNLVPWYPQCEQMRYYAVAERPAETALTALEKFPLRGRMYRSHERFIALVETAAQPLDIIFSADLGNSSWEAFTFETSLSSGLAATVAPASGTVAAWSSTRLTITVTSDELTPGIYQSQLQITANEGTANRELAIELAIWVADSWERVYLPLVNRP
jgi:hypothetical protein